jgi:hypothetical protein
MCNYVCERLRGFFDRTFAVTNKNLCLTYRYEFFRLEDLEFANAFYLDGIRIWHLTMHAQKVA